MLEVFLFLAVFFGQKLTIALQLNNTIKTIAQIALEISSLQGPTSLAKIISPFPSS